MYRKLDSAILMMKAAQDRRRCDNAEALNRTMERGIFVQRAMDSRFIVIARIGLQRAAQLSLAQRDDVVDALSTDRSDQPFGKAVLPRRAWGNRLVADAHGT